MAETGTFPAKGRGEKAGSSILWTSQAAGQAGGWAGGLPLGRLERQAFPDYLTQQADGPVAASAPACRTWTPALSMPPGTAWQWKGAGMGSSAEH